MINNDYEKKNLNQNFISENDSFSFRCVQCGSCCRNIAPKDKILLSTVDLYRAAKALNIEITEVMAQYCDMIPGGESMLPLVVMKERLDGSCIFLKKGKCIIHESKPLVCALHPLGRMLFLNEQTDEQEFHYYLKDFECSAAKDEQVKVSEWLDRFHIKEYDECVRLYKRMGSVCSKLMHAAESMEEKRNMFSTAFYLMYAKYTKDEELYPQIAQNLAFIQSMNPKQSFDPAKMS